MRQPLRSRSSACSNPRGSRGHESQGSSNPSVLRVHFSGALKVGVPNVGYKLLTPHGGAPSFEFPPDCGPPHQGWDYEAVFQNSCHPPTLSHLPDAKGSLCQFVVCLFFFLEQIVPHVAVDFTCLWGGGEFSPPSHHLEPEAPHCGSDLHSLDG